MKIEEQVTSLELSKRLAGLGCKQDSQFYWVNDCPISEDDPARGGYDEWDIYDKDDALCFGERYSAYTIGEVLYKLPYRIVADDKNYYLRILKFGHGVQVEYYNEDLKSGYGKIFSGETFDELAKMLICLIENKLTKK